MIKHVGVKYACNQCDYQATTQGYLTTHIQNKHEGLKYVVIRVIIKLKSSLTLEFILSQSMEVLHYGIKHESVKYACNLCHYQATTQGHLTTHIQNKQEGVKYVVISVIIKLKSSVT